MTGKASESLGVKDGFFFLCSRDGELGFFISRRLYYLVLTFVFAKSNAKTWSEFWEAMDSDCQAYLKVFMEVDGHDPQPEDDLDSLVAGGEVFILTDVEFPLAQCVEETYTINKDSLPMDLLQDELRTEYGASIGRFLKSDFKRIQAHFEHIGIAVDQIFPLLPFHIRHYSPAGKLLRL